MKKPPGLKVSSLWFLVTDSPTVHATFSSTVILAVCSCCGVLTSPCNFTYALCLYNVCVCVCVSVCVGVCGVCGVCVCVGCVCGVCVWCVCVCVWCVCVCVCVWCVCVCVCVSVSVCACVACMIITPVRGALWFVQCGWVYFLLQRAGHSGTTADLMTRFRGKPLTGMKNSSWTAIRCIYVMCVYMYLWIKASVYVCVCINVSVSVLSSCVCMCDSESSGHIQYSDRAFCALFPLCHTLDVIVRAACRTCQLHFQTWHMNEGRERLKQGEGAKEEECCFLPAVELMSA